MNGSQLFTNEQLLWYADSEHATTRGVKAVVEDYKLLREEFIVARNRILELEARLASYESPLCLDCQEIKCECKRE